VTTFEITEGRLRLAIDCERAVKWDEDPAYRSGVERLGGTKAVDVCAVVSGEGPVLLEIKDFRGHGTENKERMTSGALAEEVACKVRDTLAGLVWSCARGLSRDHEKLAAPFINERAPPPRVVFWLEHDEASPAIASALQDRIRSALRKYFPARVTVTSSLLEKQSRHPLAWITVRGASSAKGT
jgi:hypothetical protein